jgi:hypothetical protein
LNYSPEIAVTKGVYVPFFTWFRDMHMWHVGEIYVRGKDGRSSRFPAGYVSIRPVRTYAWLNFYFLNVWTSDIVPVDEQQELF